MACALRRVVFQAKNLATDQQIDSATAAEISESSEAKQRNGARGGNRRGAVDERVINAGGAAGLVDTGAVDRINRCLHAHEDRGSVVSDRAERDAGLIRRVVSGGRPRAGTRRSRGIDDRSEGRQQGRPVRATINAHDDRPGRRAGGAASEVPRERHIGVASPAEGRLVVVAGLPDVTREGVLAAVAGGRGVRGVVGTRGRQLMGAGQASAQGRCALVTDADTVEGAGGDIARATGKRSRNRPTDNQVSGSRSDTYA